MNKVAILVDGGFYRWRAYSLFGDKSPKDRADELFSYCLAHLYSKRKEENELYRIFYYDCEPADKLVYNPISKKNINLKNSETYKWTTAFLEELKKKRKVALRLGKLSVHNAFTLPNQTIKDLANGKKLWSDITADDVKLNIEQKGVDMRVGVDIASLAFKQQVNQIILISGDSDFVPAAKLARREGIDFIIDAMEAHIADDLFEHIDGLKSKVKYMLKKMRATTTENTETQK